MLDTQLSLTQASRITTATESLVDLSFMHKAIFIDLIYITFVDDWDQSCYVIDLVVLLENKPYPLSKKLFHVFVQGRVKSVLLPDIVIYS